mgnify:FL=1
MTIPTTDPRFVAPTVQLPSWFAPAREVYLLVGGKPECLMFDHLRVDYEIRTAVLKFVGDKSAEVITRAQYEHAVKAQQEAAMQLVDVEWDALTDEERWPVLNEIRELAQVGCAPHHPYSRVARAALRKLESTPGKT